MRQAAQRLRLWMLRGGRKVPAGLKCGSSSPTALQPRVMAIMAAIVGFTHLLAGFDNPALVLADQLASRPDPAIPELPPFFRRLPNQV